MYVHCEAVHLLHRQNGHVLHAGNLLPTHLETELDEQLANLAGCSLLQFLFFLLQDLQLKSQNFSFKSHWLFIQRGAMSFQQAHAIHGPGDAAISDCSLAEIDVQHKQQIKALIGTLRP